MFILLKRDCLNYEHIFNGWEKPVNCLGDNISDFLLQTIHTLFVYGLNLLVFDKKKRFALCVGDRLRCS